jgi:hypothetical protein
MSYVNTLLSETAFGFAGILSNVLPRRAWGVALRPHCQDAQIGGNRTPDKSNK